MTTNRNDQFHRVRTSLLVPFLLICSLSVFAQNTQYDRGTPPQHAAGVSPLGSYTSADLGTVNLSNGALNLKFPIGSVGGRGFSLPLTLNWSSKIWSGGTDTETDRDGSTKTVAYADFGKLDDYAGFYERLRPGWTVGIVPTLFNRIVRINYTNINPQGPCYHYTLPKLTMMMPDKGEIEFRDDAYDGMPLPSDCSGYVAGSSRGRRWHATDGSGTIYISDIDNAAAQRYGDLSGVVITSEGMRYHFNGGGLCDLITDRNGNKITFQNTNGITITDQLGRITTIQQDVTDPQNQSVTLALLVTLPGYNGQSRYYKVKTGTMNQHYRSDINPTLPVITGDYDPLSYGYGWGTATRLFNHSYGLYAQEIDIWEVPTELILPDGRSVHFNYNQYGEVAEIQMPTGGKVWYDYDGFVTLPAGNSPVWETTGDLHTQVFIDRALRKRRTFPDGSTLECTWDYFYQGTSTQVTATSASGSLMLDQRHYFLAADRYYYPPTGQLPDGTQNTLWSTGIEYRTETRDAAGVIIAATEQDWMQRAAVSWSSYPQEQPANDNRVNEARKILDSGSMAKVDTTYQWNVRINNPIEVREYDFDQSLKRRTTTTYADSSNLINGLDYSSDSIHLLSLPLVMTVYDGSSNQVAQTTNEYDNYTNDGNHALLQDYGSVTQHDLNYGASYTTRGNVTRTGRWLNLTNSFIYSFLRYDDLGNVVSAKDPNGNVASISFADDFGNGSNPGGGSGGTYGPTYALPALITSPPPSPGGPVQTARSQYDFSTGLLTGFKDRNNVVTQTLYNDPFNRPTQVKSALNTSVETHAAMYYAPATALGITLTNNDVLSASDQTAIDDAALRSWTRTDRFGRTVQAWSRDPLGDDEVVTIYDSLGRVKQVSSPFRPSLGETATYSTSVYDLAGRVTSVTTPDSAAVTSSYSGNTVTVTDQAGKQRKSVSDALGRLIQVYEDPSGLNYLTSYSYDTLDNLTTVSQGSQTRTFVYDSLKRLTSATNPESGTVSYIYDSNGNLTQKTDARGVVTYYGYDALNRNTGITYSDGVTMSVGRAYDQTGYGIGRLSWEWQCLDATHCGSADSFNYDALGRVVNRNQAFYTNGTLGANFGVYASYDLAGHLKTETYPSNHTVTYNYDGAGRLADNGSNLAFTGNLGDGVTRTYAKGITYDASSRMTRELFGTDTLLYHNSHYNVRGQLFDTRVGSGTDGNGPEFTWNRGCLQMYYEPSYTWGASGVNNNGNLLRSLQYLPNNDQISSFSMNNEDYTYDSLNRLTSASEAGPIYTQTYTYDRWGNRTIDYNNSTSNIPRQQFAVAASTNRLGVPSGQSGTMTYDNAGNLINDTYDLYSGHGQRTYDAENHMTAAQDASSGWSYYTYDAGGNRVRRKINNQETWQIYGVGGELLAEYAANASPSSPQKEYGYSSGQLLVTATSTSNDIQWLVTDQLGTPRMIFDKTGSLAGTKRHDYLPFGEELFAGIGSRSAALGYGVANDGVRQKFTQKERDIETGLDYFLARYYSSTQGRFTSPDEFTGGPQEIGILGSGHPEKQALKYAEVTNPQSLNKYQYCFNNPLRFIDPDGQNPQDGYELTLQRDEKALLAGKMSPEEFQARHNARAAGAAIGAGIVVAGVLIYEAPSIVTGILSWMVRNPDTVNQLQQDALQMSTGSPAPASVPRLNPEAIEQFGSTIARDVSGMSGGQMGTIATRVSECGLNQADAVGVVQTAIQKVGKSSVAVPQANGSVVVASVVTGRNKPILIVNQQGVVAQAKATINAGIRKGKAFFEVTDIK